MTDRDAVDRYLDLFETLTPERLDDLVALTREDVRFIDPFSDIVGRPALKQVFRKMFADVEAPRFIIVAVASSGARRYVRWRFEGRLKTPFGKPFSFEGMSEICLDDDGRIAQHTDFWDAASNVYERLPLLGPILRAIKRRIGVSR